MTAFEDAYNTLVRERTEVVIILAQLDAAIDALEPLRGGVSAEPVTAPTKPKAPKTKAVKATPSRRAPSADRQQTLQAVADAYHEAKRTGRPTGEAVMAVITGKKTLANAGYWTKQARVAGLIGDGADRTLDAKSPAMSRTKVDEQSARERAAAAL